MSGLRLSLLGAPQVESDGAPLTFDTRKATALLAYLAITGRPHSRDSLALLLWPRQPPDAARGALRRTLSTLKRGIGDGPLEIGRESIGVGGEAPLAVDAIAFRALVARPDEAALAEAVALYGGDFMQGFALRDSVEFEAWQLDQADSLRRELGGALERLADACAARGDYAAAIGHARRQLALDPLQERAHRELIRLYASSGERAAALGQYRDCVRALSRELGVVPLEQTTALYREVSEGSFAAPAAARRQTTGPARRVATVLETSAPGSARAAAGALPLTGRAAQWRQLVGAHGEVRGSGRLIALEGEAGIGKTRLAEEVLAHARAEGARGVAVRCYEEQAGLAYQPVADALRALVAQVTVGEVPERWLAEAARLLPELAQPGTAPPPGSEGPGARSRLFEGVRQVLGAAATDGAPAPVLLVDDVHWSDEASLDLITYLARRLDGWPLCLLVTWRSEEVPARSRLRRLLADAERAGAGESVTLGRLSRHEVIELAGAAERDSAFAGRLYQESEGVPFFVAEYLAAAGDEPDWALPGGARDLLRLRLEPLGETARQVFATAAVIGRSFALDILRVASGRSEEETAAAVDELLARRLVEELGAAEGPRYDFSHERMRAFVYEETSLARRRLLHRRVAQALAGQAPSPAGGARPGEPPVRAAAAAHHWRLAGDDAQAALHHRAAGEQARAVYANAEALGHFEAALALGHPDAPGLRLEIGDLQTLDGDYAAALVSYETAAAESCGAALAALEHRIAGVHHRRGDWELADSHFDAAVAALGDQAGSQLARVLADRSLTAHRRGQRERAGQLARAAREEATAAGDERALAQAHNILGVVASAAGDFDGALRELQRSLSLAERAADGDARVAALNNLALARRATADLDGALTLTDQALELCARRGDRHREAALRNNKADLLHALDRPDDAMAQLKEAVVIFADVGQPGGELSPEIWKLVEW